MTKCPAALLRHSLLGNCDFPYMTKFLSPPPPCFASYEHSHALLLLLPSSARNYCIFCLQKFVNRLEKITLPFLSNVQARTGQEQIIKVTNHSRVFFFFVLVIAYNRVPDTVKPQRSKVYGKDFNTLQL